MKIYHVETQEAYDELMIELEEKGCEWRDGEKLTDIDEFSTHGKDTYVYEERCEISISSGDYFKKYHSDVPVIEYKAKGENMTVYHVETKEAYDELMIELENKGYTWNSDAKPRNYNGFKWYEESTLIITRDKELKIVFDSINLYVCDEVENIIKYKEKGENMKLYHTETQVDYDALMIELEEKGYKWLSGDKPTCFSYWKQEKENSCVEISGKDITFGSIEWHKKEYPGTPIIKYKAKGENKHNLQKIAFDVSVAIESFARGISESESDLKEAKSSAKNLIEKIDDYLETLKPKFKVGDYVTVDVNGRTIIAKIDALRENKKEAHGLWYDKTRVNVKQDYWFLTEGNKFRHATPSEIEEYEVALTFHKHGRKPFEVKKGDLIRTPSKDFTFICNPEYYTKEEFLDYSWEFRSPVEEVNEWLEK